MLKKSLVLLNICLLLNFQPSYGSFSRVLFSTTQTLTFHCFLHEFLKGQIVVSVTNVKKMKENSDFSCVVASENLAKSVNVKFS